MNYQMDEQPSFDLSRLVNIDGALGPSLCSRLTLAMSRWWNYGEHVQFKTDQSHLQLDYDSMDKSVIAMLLHLPSLKTNNKEKNQNSVFRENDALYNANVSLFHAYIQEITLSIMFVKGCPIRTGSISEILSDYERDQIINYVLHNFYQLFYIQIEDEMILLHNSIVVISGMLQKYILDITKVICKSHLAKLFNHLHGRESNGTFRKSLPNIVIAEHVKKMIKIHKLQSPFIDQTLEISVKRKTGPTDPLSNQKFDYVYIEQKFLETSPRYELRFKNLREVENLSNIEMIHDDIVKLLTNNEVVVPFKKFDNNLHISEKKFIGQSGARSKKNDYKFIAGLTKIQVLNEFSDEF